MPANEKTSRAWPGANSTGALAPSGLPTFSAPTPTEAIEHGHHALRKGRVSIANSIYLITATTLDRQKLFAGFDAACAAARCFEDACLLGDTRMLAWVLMPDHFHGLLQLGERDDLSSVVNRLKSASARVTNRALRRTGKVWARAFHDHALRSEEDLHGVARYIIANPMRAGLVKRVGDYPFWNAVWVGQPAL